MNQPSYPITAEDLQRIDEAITAANSAYTLAADAYEHVEDGARVERNLSAIVKNLHHVRFLLLGVSLNMEDGPDRITKNRKPVEPALAHMIRDIFSTAYAPYGIKPEQTQNLFKERNDDTDSRTETR